ncbi:MAG: DNA-processing protein DprA [Bacteroidales bacterium]|nr:DNA-processing protein DprA [Bacteroidales bacterium]MCF8457195.1 DNA-processing protein DprA [Bacteroidales bacterium]
MNNPLLRYKIGISLIAGLGPVNTRKVVAQVGGIEALFSEKKNKLLKISGVGEMLANNIINQKVLDRADEEIEFINKNSIRPYFLLDNDFPYRLKQCADTPIMLYVKGDIDLNRKKILAVVGTRKASPYGIGNCTKLIEGIAHHRNDLVVVSGLAYGIDVCAHKVALANDIPTAAVLGHGLEMLYPSMHKQVAAQIEQQGALISDFTSGSKLDPTNFLKRNRIIAGLADAVIVVESAIKGGSLVTADIAQSYNRDVFSFPGRINDNYSKGCHYLIKTNRASLIENSEDLEFMMGWDIKPGKSTAIQQKLFSELNHEEQEIVGLLREYGELPIDMLSMRTKLPGSKISALLLSLEFSGYVKTLPGKMYTLA